MTTKTQRKLKNLINDDFMGTLNDEGKKLSKEIDDALKPIISKWLNEGYGLRDIHSICNYQVNGTCVFTAALHPKYIKQNRKYK